MVISRFLMVLVSTTAAIGVLGIVHADTTVEQKVTADGFGPMKIGAMQGKNVTSIAGDRARIAGDLKFNSKFLRILTHNAGADNIQIIRLDKELEYQIDPAKKQYSETTFAQMREAMQKASQQVQSKTTSESREAPSGAPVNESQCQWSAPKSEVKQGTDHTVIAGAETKHITVTVTTTCLDKTSDTSCDFLNLIDEWVAPEMPGAAESHEFWRTYATKLNLKDTLSVAMRANAQQVFEQYKGAWGEAMNKAGAIKGYPMKTVFSMQFGGPQCVKQDGSKDKPAADSTPTSPGDVVGGLAVGLFRKLHKKPDDTSSVDSSPVAPGMVQMFRMSTEIVSINSDSIPASQFEVPAGYKKSDGTS
jgi:hypothetical protein